MIFIQINDISEISSTQQGSIREYGRTVRLLYASQSSFGGIKRRCHRSNFFIISYGRFLQFNFLNRCKDNTSPKYRSKTVVIFSQLLSFNLNDCPRPQTFKVGQDPCQKITGSKKIRVILIYCLKTYKYLRSQKNIIYQHICMTKYILTV